MKIAYIVDGNPYDKNSWSGTNYYVRTSLQNQGHNVYSIYGLTPKISFVDYANKLIAKLSGASYDIKRTVSSSRQWASFIKDKIEPNTDCIVSLGTIPIAYLDDISIPIYIYVDGIFKQMCHFYNWNLSAKSMRIGNNIEHKALSKCRRIFSASDETKKAIVDGYDVSADKVCVVPLGANMDNPPTKHDIDGFIESKKDNSICSLLFVGVDWYRKGADIVLKVVESLHEQGFPVQLNLVGLKSIPVDLPSYVHNYGFINKNENSGAKLLSKLYSEAHYLFVPSRSEAYGLVFCEANAFGVPCISLNEGGLKTIVKNGVNGYLFNEDSPIAEYSKIIKQNFSDKRRYVSLCYSSYERYKELLCWEVAGQTLSQIIKDTIDE